VTSQKNTREEGRQERWIEKRNHARGSNRDLPGSPNRKKYVPIVSGYRQEIEQGFVGALILGNRNSTKTASDVQKKVLLVRVS